MTVNKQYYGFGLFMGKKKQSENVTLGSVEL